MFKFKLLAGSVFLASAMTGCGGSSSSSGGPSTPPEPVPFSFVEATVESLHTSLRTGGITCEGVVQGYIDRIEAYDKPGTVVEMRSVININPQAIFEARQMDLEMAATGIDKPLFCVPILPKDNFNTVQMPTSGGATAFAYNRPTEDAYTVRKLREAGAIVIGKANMDEFAFGFTGESSLGGLVKNAYDLTKSAGGSSTGTGASIAASFAIAGTGSDTGGSIRVPSSVGGLVGIRPSLRLVSQDGIMPLASFQDTGGPMCRTVQDCALMMDAMVGFDASAHSGQRESFEIDAPLITSEEQYKEVTGIPDTYTAFLDADGLRGKRIGVVRELFGSNDSVNTVMQAALDKMAAAGAILEEVSIPEVSAVLGNYSSLSSYQFKRDLESYLNAWPTSMDGHITDYQALIDSEGYLSRNRNSLISRGNYDLDNLTEAQQETYDRNTIERPVFVRARVMAALNNEDLEGNSLGEPFDVLIYPAMTGIHSGSGSVSAGSNNRLSPFSMFPALTMPAGMATDLDPAMPVGLELLGREFDEEMLIAVAYGYQEVAHPRVPPTHTPELPQQ
ncbi:amidase [Alcanivorax sp. S71-1-4]|uniref:amidase n=1 Tax=Alcanivorax sp. S71-1-4 TaxID=1177159 RepID=UPI00135C86E2|nr:amidase family protein [Alcanivorax sp. S71-1-4]